MRPNNAFNSTSTPPRLRGFAALARPRVNAGVRRQQAHAAPLSEAEKTAAKPPKSQPLDEVR